MTAPGKITAPWTDEQVAGLNAWQDCPWVHPFTCVETHGAAEVRVLIATEDGWRCPICDYRQEWAHGFMAEGAPPDPAELLR